jgi:hypothetical protein
VSNETRREDSRVVIKLMQSVSGKRSKMWGTSIVGFGVHHFEYASGKKGEICKIGFAPRVGSLVFYLSNFGGAAKLRKLGKHRVSGGGCLYINKLEDVDLDVLQAIIEHAYARP